MTTAGIGFVGLGVMGSAMSSHLLAAGERVFGFDLDPRRREEHRARGGDVALSPAEVTEVCDLVVSSLPSAGALDAVLSGPDGLLASARPGLVVLETSTLDLASKQRAEQAARAVGATMLDCPMSGTGAQARAGDLVAYLSGEEAAKARAVRALEPMTRGVHDLGAFGNGTRMKLVANLLVGVHNLAAAEAMLLAEHAGLRPDLVLEAVGDGAGTSRMFEIRGPLMAARAFDEATMKVSTFLKDLDLIAAFADDVRSPVPLLTTTTLFYRAAAAQGRGDQDTACVFDVLAGLASPAPSDDVPSADGGAAADGAAPRAVLPGGSTVPDGVAPRRSAR
jgi:3-hydroxyisobutyrate dehydrogenase-like beta-hydroxyacid dehydrogenase